MECCSQNTHTWKAGVDARGTRCICEKVYRPKEPFCENVLVDAGEVRDFPEGFRVTFPAQGAWQVSIMPNEPATNSKAALQVIRL